MRMYVENRELSQKQYLSDFVNIVINKLYKFKTCDTLTQPDIYEKCLYKENCVHLLPKAIMKI